MPVVRMPDGTQVSFPDEMPADQIRSLIQQRFPDAAAQPAAPVAAAPPAPADVPLPKQNPLTIPSGDVLAQQNAADTRALKIGTQGAGAGVAELVSMPADLLTAAGNLAVTGVNKVAGTNIPTMHMPSEALKHFAGVGADALGYGTIPEKDMSTSEKLGYNVNRFGTQAALAVPALVRAASLRAADFAANAAPRWFDSFLRPYAGEQVGKTVAGDMAGAVGGGSGVTIADEYGFKDPLSQGGAAIGGATGGVAVANALRAAFTAGLRQAGKVVGANIDPAVSGMVNTSLTDAPVTADVATAAARGLQDRQAYADSGARLRGNLDEMRRLDPEAPLPSPAALAEDHGLRRFESALAPNSPDAITRNREFNSGVRDTVERAVPEGANPESLLSRAQKAADERIAASAAAEDTVRAQADASARASEATIAGLENRVAQLEGRGQQVQDIRVAQGEQLRSAGGRGIEASQNLDRNIVDQGYIPRRTVKNDVFENSPGRNQQLPADEVTAAAQRVRDQNNLLRPDNQIPEDLLRRIDALAPDIQQQTRVSPITDEFGRPITTTADVNTGGPGTALGGDLADTRKYLSTAIEQARRTGNFDLADSLQTLRSAINRTIETAPGYAEANANYREFAGTYRPGPGDEAAKFTRAIDRDPTRSSTPPSQTADRFLQPGQTEKHDALARMINGAENPLAGQGAARTYLLSDMVERGVVDLRTGLINNNRLRQWQERWGDLSNVVPGFQDGINALRNDVARGERLSQRVAAAGEQARQRLTEAQQQARTTAKQFETDLRAAQRNSKVTQDQIDKGALGAVLNADPDKAVFSLMNSRNNINKNMDEVLRAIGNDQDAKNGLKAAIGRWITSKTETDAVQNMRPGDTRGPVSQAKLNDLLTDKGMAAVLARVYSPEEMNSLRAANKALNLANVERLRFGSGSDTAEKSVSAINTFLQTPLGRGTEAAIRLKYGMLKGGGIVSIARRTLGDAVGGPDANEVARVVNKAIENPELMSLLLGRKVPVGSPTWNGKVQRLMAIGEAARETGPD